MAELINNNDGTYTVNVPIIIPEAAIQAGGIELFSKAYGWSENIINEEGIEIANPQTALEKAMVVIREFVSNVFREQYIQYKKNLAEQQAIEEVNTLLR